MPASYNFQDKGKAWNIETFGIISLQKKRILARLAGIEKALSNGANDYLINLKYSLRDDLETILIREEILWKTKSRDKWLKEGGM